MSYCIFVDICLKKDPPINNNYHQFYISHQDDKSDQRVLEDPVVTRTRSKGHLKFLTAGAASANEAKYILESDRFHGPITQEESN